MSGELLQQNEDGTCDMIVRVLCSAGTYVRVLAMCLGERLGVGAHLNGLRRTRAGNFKIEDASTVEELRTMAEGGMALNLLVSPDAALSRLPFVHLSDEDVRRANHGREVRVAEPEWADGENVRMYNAGEELIAIGLYDASARSVHPQVVIGREN
jgi:tRNA pseudouridine55 synthase